MLSGSLARMFNGRSNVDLRGATRGFVVDVSKCGADDRVLRFAQLAGSRAVDQMMSSATGRTLQIGDEAWRLTGTKESVRWLQHSFKLGRNVAMSNVIVVSVSRRSVIKLTGWSARSRRDWCRTLMSTSCSARETQRMRRTR